MSVEQIVSNLKKVRDNIEEQALDILEIEGLRSVRKNFEEEGRPKKWQKKKRNDGRRILRGKTNRLFSTINSTKDKPGKRVILSSNLIYSKIHQVGGSIKTKKGVVVMPARPYMVVPDQDFPRILNKFKAINL